MAKQPRPVRRPFIGLSASQKSSGKTHYTTFLADILTLNAMPFQVFQIDDQNRLRDMIGDCVIDLRANPDLIIEDSTTSMRALTPFYDAVLQAAQNGCRTLLDSGANQTEYLANFLRDVGLAEDIQSWDMPLLVFVPFLPLDPESTAQSAFTVRRMLDAVPNARIVLVENRHGGSVERIVAGSIAEKNYDDLLKAAKGADCIIMPAIPQAYWAPFEGAGMRFLKVLALDPVEGSKQFNRSVGEIKIMKAAVLRFWRAMHQQLAGIIHLPLGGGDVR